MLIIQRRAGERIIMSNGVEITVRWTTKSGVRLALTVPKGIGVVRGEVYDAVAAANAAAAQTSFEPEVEGEGEGEARTASAPPPSRGRRKK